MEAGIYSSGFSIFLILLTTFVLENRGGGKVVNFIEKYEGKLKNMVLFLKIWARHHKLVTELYSQADVFCLAHTKDSFPNWNNIFKYMTFLKYISNFSLKVGRSGHPGPVTTFSRVQYWAVSFGHAVSPAPRLQRPLLAPWPTCCDRSHLDAWFLWPPGLATLG